MKKETYNLCEEDKVFLRSKVVNKDFKVYQMNCSGKLWPTTAK